jgi:hypothetical protein
MSCRVNGRWAAVDPELPAGAQSGPGVFVIDFSALKNFQFGAGNYLQLRIEAFNLLNRPNFGYPNTNLGQSNWNAAANNSIPTPGGGAFGTIN